MYYVSNKKYNRTVLYAHFDHSAIHLWALKLEGLCCHQEERAVNKLRHWHQPVMFQEREQT